MTVHPRKVTDEERAEAKMVGHNMFERTRVDIIRIMDNVFDSVMMDSVAWGKRCHKTHVRQL